LILNPLYVDKVVIPKDMSVDLIDAYILIEWLKMGRLKGEFKKIASTLKMGDNPVVNIVKFK